MVGSGTPVSPALSMSLSAAEVVIRWDQDGYQLEVTSTLGGTWTPVTTTGREYREPTSTASANGRRFFRLKR
jgi:hypothetical protein